VETRRRNIAGLNVCAEVADEASENSITGTCHKARETDRQTKTTLFSPLSLSFPSRPVVCLTCHGVYRVSTFTVGLVLDALTGYGHTVQEAMPVKAQGYLR
jgi:hypothetical protein